MKIIVQEWVGRLYKQGLIVLPCWGGGKALPGTRYHNLADNPPSMGKVTGADYFGGLAILLGTRHPGGGFVTALDIDEGPETFPNWPSGYLLVEEGTAAGKWHIFLSTKDRLNGQVNLYDRDGKLVAEIKGYGLALRSWPTIPKGKPRGYRVVTLIENPNVIPVLTVADTISWLRGILSFSLRKEIHRKDLNIQQNKNYISVVPSSGLIRNIEEELNRRQVNLRPSGRDGWHLGRCPFHEDARPSFSISFELGAWKCWSGCGSGSFKSLARRLGLNINSWEVR